MYTILIHTLIDISYIVVGELTITDKCSEIEVCNTKIIDKLPTYNYM